MTTDELAAYLASFPKGTPVMADDGKGPIPLKCKPKDLFLQLVDDSRTFTKYVFIIGDLAVAER
jgi:hypothetical protein